LTGRLHQNLAFEVDCWEHLLLEEYEVFREAAKVLVVLKELNSLLVVLGVCHDQHLAEQILREQNWLFEIFRERERKRVVGQKLCL